LTFVVNESCIRCKIMDCVDVCPVDCLVATTPGGGAPIGVMVKNTKSV